MGLIENDAGQTLNYILKLATNEREKIMQSIFYLEGSVDKIVNKVEIDDFNTTKPNMVYNNSIDSSLQL